ncbi:MAG: Lrp/AsnC family transcriptional regulator [Nanoarchaeota archaeon]|nr:Lrp/AsnC family transcriptional regulator [Nanoarchaeota archaeon]MBU1622754.1 Lrp/AsnC family transcriptional regulator [Nanoarchaeota archaeon]MBU1974480.1 Lrp/AsnC family transcriptional regulator [Nanoarchaeota archaeon]
MKQPDPENPHLTRNDQEVLKKIIQSAKLPDTEIAKQMGLSPQAVFKIRHKLENKGIIKGYQPILDLEKLGIKVMVMLIIKLTSEVWESHSDEQISQRIRQIPYVINAYRITEPKASHILIMGFRDLEQMDRYMAKIQTLFSREIEIIHIYPFSTKKVITESPIGLLYEILDKKEFPLNEFFLKKK